jgi:polo-like kinase 1
MDPKTRDMKSKRYLMGKFLGKGGFAKVYEITDLDSKKNTMLAAKLIAKEQLEKKNKVRKLEFEIRVHRKLHHENIVKFHHYFEDEKYVYILLDLCSASMSDLVKKRKKLTEVEAQCYSL